MRTRENSLPVTMPICPIWSRRYVLLRNSCWLTNTSRGATTSVDATDPSCLRVSMLSPHSASSRRLSIMKSTKSGSTRGANHIEASRNAT